MNLMMFDELRQGLKAKMVQWTRILKEQKKQKQERFFNDL